MQYNKHINPFLKGLPLDSERRFQDTVLKCENRCLEELYHSCDLIARVTVQKIQEKRDVYLKLTRHNGRAGTHGTYNPKHNDRSFNLANSEHIDPERAKGNIYWDCFHGFRSALAPQDPDDLAGTFSDVERQFYETRYSEFIERQNERNAKIRHTERNRSIPDLLSSRKTCPEETIYQLGTEDDHASGEVLLAVVTEFIEEFKARFGDHVHVLDWALHLDESTPHIHERHVFDCENKHGEVAPQQEKALEALGFELPDPGKPLSRRSNRKITFDSAVPQAMPCILPVYPAMWLQNLP